MYNYIKDTLHFNVWHHYTSLLSGWDDNTADNYFDSVGHYASIVTTRKGLNDNNGLRTYFDRPTVSYIISGQRTDYECENITENSCLYWFNSYNNSMNNNITVFDTNDYSRYGAGERVKYCRTNNSVPESIACYINTGINANRNLSYGKTANPWCADDAWDWYVMPRIRIDSVYAAGTIHNEEVVCRIEITGWDDSFLKTIELKVKNFKITNDSTYNGIYLEEYYMRTGQENFNIYCISCSS